MTRYVTNDPGLHVHVGRGALGGLRGDAGGAVRTAAWLPGDGDGGTDTTVKVARARLLAHVNLQTTERHYIVADTAVAIRAHHAAIANILGDEGARPRRNRRRPLPEAEE